MAGNALGLTPAMDPLGASAMGDAAAQAKRAAGWKKRAQRAEAELQKTREALAYERNEHANEYVLATAWRDVVREWLDSGVLTLPKEQVNQMFQAHKAKVEQTLK